MSDIELIIDGPCDGACPEQAARAVFLPSGRVLGLCPSHTSQHRPVIDERGGVVLPMEASE